MIFFFIKNSQIKKKNNNNIVTMSPPQRKSPPQWMIQTPQHSRSKPMLEQLLSQAAPLRSRLADESKPHHDQVDALSMSPNQFLKSCNSILKIITKIS